MSRRTLAAIVGLLAGLVAMQATANAASLYTGPVRGPGPDLLYAGARHGAPAHQRRQLEGRRRSSISGASAYREGEFLYQDFLYDDHGAHGAPRPGRPARRRRHFSKPNGTYTYPTDRVYASNAADLVEFRVKPLEPTRPPSALTLNTLKDPSQGRLHDRHRRHGRLPLAVPPRRERRARRPTSS